MEENTGERGRDGDGTERPVPIAPARYMLVLIRIPSQDGSLWRHNGSIVSRFLCLLPRIKRALLIGGILDEWLSNTKEIQMRIVSSARVRFTDDPYNSRLVKVEHFAAWIVMGFRNGKKLPAWFVALRFLRANTRGHVAGHAQISIDPALSIKLGVH